MSVEKVKRKGRGAGWVRRAGRLDLGAFRNTILLQIFASARKHGLADEDIKHAVRNALAVDQQNEDRLLWIGPARSAQLLEVVTVQMKDGRDIAIHAMPLPDRSTSAYSPDEAGDGQQGAEELRKDHQR